MLNVKQESRLYKEEGSRYKRHAGIRKIVNNKRKKQNRSKKGNLG